MTIFYGIFFSSGGLERKISVLHERNKVDRSDFFIKIQDYFFSIKNRLRIGCGKVCKAFDE